MKKALAMIMVIGMCGYSYANSGAMTAMMNKIAFIFTGQSALSETSMTISNTAEQPWYLQELTAVTNGASVAVTVNRVFRYTREVEIPEVSTNLFGVVGTNTVTKSSNSLVTNLVYTSASDTLPDNVIIMPNEGLILDFGAVSNVLVRLVGVTP